MFKRISDHRKTSFEAMDLMRQSHQPLELFIRLCRNSKRWLSTESQLREQLHAWK
jgi:hypothetical protein